MEDLQIAAEEEVLQEAVALLHAVALMVERIAVMAGAKVHLHAVEVLPEMEDAKKGVLLQDVDKALAKELKEK